MVFSPAVSGGGGCASFAPSGRLTVSQCSFVSGCEQIAMVFTFLCSPAVCR